MSAPCDKSNYYKPELLLIFLQWSPGTGDIGPLPLLQVTQYFGHIAQSTSAACACFGPVPAAFHSSLHHSMDDGCIAGC